MCVRFLAAILTVHYNVDQSCVRAQEAVTLVMCNISLAARLVMVSFQLYIYGHWCRHISKTYPQLWLN